MAKIKSNVSSSRADKQSKTLKCFSYRGICCLQYAGTIPRFRLVLFERQYTLTLTEETEVRYRTERRTGSYTDAEGNLHSYEYTVQVPYTYYICTVRLENFNLSHVPVHIMSHDQLSMYAVYMSVLGNRPDLFPGSPYVNRYPV